MFLLTCSLFFFLVLLVAFAFILIDLASVWIDFASILNSMVSGPIAEKVSKQMSKNQEKIGQSVEK